MFDPVVLKVRIIERNHTNCFIGLFMRNKMECKIANPVTSVPSHYIVQKPEHEIRGHSIPTMWQKDNEVLSFDFFISMETGIYHLYVGGVHIENICKFGLSKISCYDQVYIDAISMFAEKMGPCLGYDMRKCSVGVNSTVPVRHKWYNPVNKTGKTTFTSYHSYKYNILMPITAQPDNSMCRKCQHDLWYVVINCSTIANLISF